MSPDLFRRGLLTGRTPPAPPLTPLKRVQKSGQLFNGYGSVTNFILLLLGHLGKCPIITIGNKNRIVTEPAVSTSRIENMSFYRTLKKVLLQIGRASLSERS